MSFCLKRQSLWSFPAPGASPWLFRLCKPDGLLQDAFRLKWVWRRRPHVVLPRRLPSLWCSLGRLTARGRIQLQETAVSAVLDSCGRPNPEFSLVVSLANDDGLPSPTLGDGILNEDVLTNAKLAGPIVVTGLHHELHDVGSSLLDSGLMLRKELGLGGWELVVDCSPEQNFCWRQLGRTSWRVLEQQQ